MLNLTFLSQLFSNLLKMSIKSSIISSVTLLTFIWVVMKSSEPVGTWDLQLKHSWLLKISKIMDNFKCIGDSKWNKPSLRTDLLCSGEMTLKTSKLQITTSFIIGEPKQIFQRVIYFLVVLVLGNSTSRIILSPSDFLYINKGFGNIWFSNSAGAYNVWKQIYQGFNLFPPGIDRNKILGA